MIGFMVGGAFLGLAYFDFFYANVAVACILSTLLAKARAQSGSSAAGALHLGEASQRVAARMIRR